MEKLDTYQRMTLRTAPVLLSKEERINNAILSLCGEAGELANALKKVKYQGHDFEQSQFVSEMGDCLWYLAELCNALEINLSDVAFQNIEKLKRRYPDGFSKEASRNRKE